MNAVYQASGESSPVIDEQIELTVFGADLLTFDEHARQKRIEGLLLELWQEAKAVSPNGYALIELACSGYENSNIRCSVHLGGAPNCSTNRTFEADLKAQLAWCEEQRVAKDRHNEARMRAIIEDVQFSEFPRKAA